MIRSDCHIIVCDEDLSQSSETRRRCIGGVPSVLKSLVSNSFHFTELISNFGKVLFKETRTLFWIGFALIGMSWEAHLIVLCALDAEKY